MNNDTYTINLIGPPGTGKTTIAARLFSELKIMGYRAEWVPEYAKLLVRAGDRGMRKLNNQHAISMRQADMLDAVQGMVRFVVTDGALLNGIYYNACNPDNVSDVKKTHAAIASRYNKHRNINIYLERGDFAYETEGRYQTEAQARAMDAEFRQWIASTGAALNTFTSDVENVPKMVETILLKVKQDVSEYKMLEDMPPPEEIDQVPAFIRFQMALDTIATAHSAMPLMGRSLTENNQPENLAHK